MTEASNNVKEAAEKAEKPKGTPPKPKKERRLFRYPHEHRIVYYIARYLFRIFYASAGRFQAFGTHNIPKSGPVILCPNHCSHLDPPLVAACIQREVWFMSKEELFYVPVLGKLMPYFHGFPVRRGAADRAALKRALDYLAYGDVVVIFPEGERSRDGQLKEGELGVGMIALRSKATVIPVGIKGSYEMLSPDDKMLKRGHLRVTYGPPVDLSDLYGKRENRETLQECTDRIMKAIADVLGVPPPQKGSRDSVGDGAAGEKPGGEVTPKK